jgi:transposase
MQTITTIGLDIAKSVFQVHGVDAGGQAVIRRQLKRRYVLAFFQKLKPCLVGIEACASAHHWSRTAYFGRSAFTGSYSRDRQSSR